jgi:hypothetical protein
MTLLFEKITVAKSREVKIRSSLAEFSKEGYGSKSAVLPVMMLNIYIYFFFGGGGKGMFYDAVSSQTI